MMGIYADIESAGRIDPALAASALEWWADAGVDMFVDETVRDWFGASGKTAAGPASRGVTAAPVRSDKLPDDYASFAAWRMSEHVPEAAWRGVSVPASGPDDAALMVMVDCPDRGDDDAGRLLSNSAGRLFDRMLAAIGFDRSRVHLASICVRRPTSGRIPTDQEVQLGVIARHHVSIIAPERLLLMGNIASKAVVGMEMVRARGASHQFDGKKRQTKTIVSFHPRFLIQRPSAKAEAWKDLQRLMKGSPE